MAALQYRRYSSIRDIPREHWDAAWPPLTEGYDFYLSQQEAGIEGFEFHYLALYAGETLALVAPMFTAHFNMGLAMGDAGRRRLHKLQRIWPRCLVFKTLFCGSPVSEKGVVGIHPGHRGDAGLFEAFDSALLALAREQRARMIVLKDLMDPEAQALAPLRALGWFASDGLPTANLPIGFASMDEYLGQLGYGTRKNLRRKLRQTAQSGGLMIEAVSDISHCIDDVYRLYLEVYQASELHFERLTKPFFLNFTRFMPGNTVFFLYWARGPTGAARKLVAFNFCLQVGDRLIDKYIGLDYSVSRKLNLYFVSFLNNVQWCLDHNKKNYMLSQGGYPVKLQLGAKPIPLRMLTRIVNPAVNWFACRFA